MNGSAEKTMMQQKWVGWFLKKACLMIFDVIALNASYYLALVMRFFMGGKLIK